MLLKAGADPSTNSSLILAVYNENYDAAIVLLDDPRVDPDDPASDCCTSLHYVAVRGNVRLTRAILARSETNPNYTDDGDDELTLIESACKWIGSVDNAKEREGITECTQLILDDPRLASASSTRVYLETT